MAVNMYVFKIIQNNLEINSEKQKGKTFNLFPSLSPLNPLMIM